MADRSVRVVLSAAISDFQAKMAQAKSSVDDFGKKLDANRKSADVLAGGLLKIGTVAAIGVGFAVKSAADFEQAMSYVKATGEDAAANFDALREAAVKMGAETVFSASEAAAGIENLLKAGVSAKDVLGGGLSGALDLAAAGSLEVGAAAEIAATALTQFGLSGEQVPHVADLLAAGAGKAQGEVYDLGMALKQSGLVAAQFGLSIEETVGGLSAFASAGLLGSDAGTSLKTMLQRMAAPSREAAATMADLGIAAYDAQGNFVGLEGLAGQLQAAMTNLAPAQRDAAMATIFGADAVRAANVLYKNGAQGIADWTAKVNDQGYAAETAATKLDNLKGDLEAFTGALDAVLIDGGSGVNQALREMTQSATGFVQAIGQVPAPVLQVGAGLTAIVAAGGLVAGGLLKAVATARDLHSAFRDLVPVGSALDGKLRAIGAGAAAGAIGLAAMGAAVRQVQDGVSKSLPSVGDLEAQLSRISSGSADFSALEANFAGLEGRAGDLGQAMRFLSDRQAGNIVGWTKAGDAIKGFAAGLVGAKTDVQGVEEAFDRIDQALVNMSPEAAAAAFEALSKGADGGRYSAELLAEAYDDYTAKLQGTASASGPAVTGAEAISAALMGTAEAADGAAKSLDDVGSAMLKLSGSQMGVEEAIDGATEALKKNGETLDITTEAGRANQSALDGIAAASLSLASSQREAGASAGVVDAAMAKNRESFIAAATSMGMTEGQAKLLADAYGLIPGSVSTSVSAPGATASAEQVKDLQAKIDSLPPQKRAQIAAIFETDGYAAAKAAYDSIHSKTVTITQRYVPMTGTIKAAAAADGALFGPGLVQMFAAGGIKAPSIGSQQPQIRSAGGRGILWAEDGAGPWEGFVSGHPAKRSRSRVITEEIARRLGGDVQWFADGGFMGATPGAGGGLSRDMLRAIAAAVDSRPIVSQVILDGRVLAESTRRHDRAIR